MSLAVYEETEKDIQDAYKEKRFSKIEKETSYILSQLIVSMMDTFQDRIKRIKLNTRVLHFDEDYIRSDKNMNALINWMKRMMQLDLPITNEEFGKLKMDFEDWFYQIGGKDFLIEYEDEYLLKPSEAASMLGVSTVTFNKYVKQGLECMDTNSHYKIPKHAVDLWKDPVSAIKMQMLFQKKKLKTQSLSDRLKEVNEEITEYQIQYGTTTCGEAFIGTDIDSIDDPSDYFDWRDLEEEKNDIMNKLKGEKRVEEKD